MHLLASVPEPGSLIRLFAISCVEGGAFPEGELQGRTPFP